MSYIIVCRTQAGTLVPIRDSDYPDEDVIAEYPTSDAAIAGSANAIACHIWPWEVLEVTL